MASAKTFVVAGVTGWQGGAAARHLKKAGHRVIGISHTPSKATKLEDIGIEPFIADLRVSAERKQVGRASKPSQDCLDDYWIL
jgi:uncharacterized protein YbjT (DUF2867 family)